MNVPWVTTGRLVGLTGIASVLGGVLLGYLLFHRAATDDAALTRPVSVADCVSHNINLTKPQQIATSYLRDLTELCYDQLHREGLLNDFRIRRLKFIVQGNDERVLLWMVVFITTSGVLLAGLQLIHSFSTSSLGTGGAEAATDLTLEQNKISLKSSITGLFILLISFLFFSVFVYEIFRIKEVNVDAVALQTPSPPAQIGVGIIKPHKVGPQEGQGGAGTGGK